MQQFAFDLDALSSHASDPLPTAALLRSYNQAEEGMLTTSIPLRNTIGSKANAAAAATSSNS